MNDLQLFKAQNIATLDSRDVAVMVGKSHPHLLRDIGTYIVHIAEINQSNNGSVNEPKIRPVDFFIESTYTDVKGETRPCYLITRKGCELIANKLTGAKGIKFTATYIERFHAMEEALSAPQKVLSPLELLKAQVAALQAIEDRQNEQQAALDIVSQRLDSIGDIISLSPTAWREDSRKMIVRIAEAMGGIHFIREVQTDIYKLLRERFGIDIKTRLTNMVRRAAEEGVTKSRRDKLTKVDAISQDKRAIEAYLAIIKEMAIKYGVDKPA